MGSAGVSWGTYTPSLSRLIVCGQTREAASLGSVLVTGAESPTDGLLTGRAGSLWFHVQSVRVANLKNKQQ